MKNKVLIFSLILVLAVFIQVLIVMFSRLDGLYAQQTEMLCAEYANRDHEKEFVPERWSVIKDLYSPQDWYDSCIKHSSKNKTL